MSQIKMDQISLTEKNVCVYLDPRHIYNYIIVQDQVYLHDVELDCLAEITDLEEIHNVRQLFEFKINGQ